MKLIHTIRGFIAQQKNLYFIFVGALMVATLFLFYTEPMSIATRFAFILLPLSVQMALLLLFPKPGVVFWILFPKLIFDAFQLVLLYLFNESIIAVDMFLNLASTNATEAGELLGNLTPAIVGLILFYVPCLALAVYSIRNKTRLSPSFRKSMAKWSALLFVVGLLSAGAARLQDPEFRFKYQIYPLNVFYNLSFAIDKFERSENYPQSSANFTFQAHRNTPAVAEIDTLHTPQSGNNSSTTHTGSKAVTPTQTPPTREIYVLVIGETSRAANWSLYGYSRHTNPKLEQEPGMVAFSDALTQSNTTHKIVPIILSSASAENYEVIYTQKSIITAFKEVGFKTIFLSNQVPNNSFTDYFSQEADIRKNVSPQNTQVYSESRPDGEMIPMLQTMIDTTAGNLFIVLHTYGSHFNYYKRYPSDFARFVPDVAESVSKRYKTELINSYDNSILYIDHMLSEVMGVLRESGAQSAMLYLSDHGEDILDDQRGLFLHASPTPTYYQLHVPYILWFSTDYQQAHPSKLGTALSHKNTPISSNSVFHTLLDLAAISTPYFDSTLSVVSSNFVTRGRQYLNDHDKSTGINSLRLKPQDIEMLNKHHIKYLPDPLTPQAN